MYGTLRAMLALYDQITGDISNIIKQEQLGKITPSDAVAKIHRLLVNLDAALSDLRRHITP